MFLVPPNIDIFTLSHSKKFHQRIILLIFFVRTFGLWRYICLMEGDVVVQVDIFLLC